MSAWCRGSNMQICLQGTVKSDGRACFVPVRTVYKEELVILMRKAYLTHMLQVDFLVMWPTVQCVELSGPP